MKSRNPSKMLFLAIMLSMITGILIAAEDPDQTRTLEPLNLESDKTPTLENMDLKFGETPKTLSPSQGKKRKTPQSRARKLIEDEQRRQEEWINQ